MGWVRRMVAWVGLLGVLLHAGLVVHHRAFMAMPGVDAAMLVAGDGLAQDLSRALMAAMCGKGPAALDSGAATPEANDLGTGPTPSNDGSVPSCPVCCCPTVQILTIATGLPDPRPDVEPLAQRVRWHAVQATIAERSRERPPVRGPPRHA